MLKSSGARLRRTLEFWWNPDRKQFWIAVAVSTRFFFFLYFILCAPSDSGIEGFIGRASGDLESYVQPIENLLSKGVYIHDPTRPITYAGRMPGYGAVYLLYRLFLPQGLALSAVIISQFLLGAISVYYLAKIGQKVFGSTIAFYATYFLYLIDTYVSVWDSFALTESFGAASLIFGLYFLICRDGRKRRIDIVVSGGFLTWCVFLRPFMAPVLVACGIYLVWRELRSGESLKSTVARLALLLMPFAVADGVWVARNYRIYRRLVPLQINTTAGYGYEDSELALRRFISAWGGDFIPWNAYAAGYWFAPPSEGLKDLYKHFEPPQDEFLPDYIYTSAYNLIDLKRARELHWSTYEPGLSLQERRRRIAQTAELFDGFTEAFRRQRPFHYYFWSRAILAKRFLLHSGTYNILPKPFSESLLLEKVFKLFESLLYWLSLIFGFSGLIYYTRRGEAAILLIAFVPVFFVVLFPGMGFIEYRMFVLAYPLLKLLAAVAMVELCYTLVNLAQHKSGEIHALD